MSFTKEFSINLSMCQGEIKHAILDAKNPHFKSDYATLESTINAIKPFMTKYGFSVVQSIVEKEHMYLETTLMSEFGSLITTVPMIVTKNDMQGLGSAITYARRYALLAVFNIGSEDDDGNLAVETMSKPAVFNIGSEDDDGNLAVETMSKPAVKNHAPQAQPTKVSLDYKTFTFAKGPFLGKRLYQIDPKELEIFMVDLDKKYHGHEMPAEIEKFLTMYSDFKKEMKK
jgi:hypothetical protein